MKQGKSALTYVLLALVPYTRENLLPTFQPSKFFYELERTSKYSSAALRTAYSQAKRQKLVFELGDTVELSLHARQRIQPYIAKKFARGQLMVIFDIPEDFSAHRRKFRYILRQLKFRQIQQSVWMSEFDSCEIIKETIAELRIAGWVQLYESARIDV